MSYMIENAIFFYSVRVDVGSSLLHSRIAKGAGTEMKLEPTKGIRWDSTPMRP